MLTNHKAWIRVIKIENLYKSKVSVYNPLKSSKNSLLGPTPANIFYKIFNMCLLHDTPQKKNHKSNSHLHTPDFFSKTFKWSTLYSDTKYDSILNFLSPKYFFLHLTGLTVPLIRQIMCWCCCYWWWWIK